MMSFCYTIDNRPKTDDINGKCECELVRSSALYLFRRSRISSMGDVRNGDTHNLFVAVVAMETGNILQITNISYLRIRNFSSKHSKCANGRAGGRLGARMQAMNADQVLLTFTRFLTRLWPAHRVRERKFIASSHKGTDPRTHSEPLSSSFLSFSRKYGKCIKYFESWPFSARNEIILR